MLFQKFKAFKGKIMNKNRFFRLRMIKNTFKGKLIVFTGIDGTGKTTLQNKAKEYLEGKGRRCFLTKMPSKRIQNMSVFKKFNYSNSEAERKKVEREYPGCL